MYNISSFLIGGVAARRLISTMRIVREVLGSLDLLYIYLKEVPYTSPVRTIAGLKAELLFDDQYNWIGLHIHDNAKELFDGCWVKFSLGSRHAHLKSVVCNIDIDIIDGTLFGIELILERDIIRPIKGNLEISTVHDG